MISDRTCVKQDIGNPERKSCHGKTVLGVEIIPAESCGLVRSGVSGLGCSGEQLFQIEGSSSVTRDV